MILAPFPDISSISDKTGMLTNVWRDWFLALLDAINDGPGRLFTTTLTGQSAAIAATDMTDGTLAAGLYRVSYYARITTAAAISSSLTVTIAWTDSAVSPSYSGAALTGNTTTTIQSGTQLIRLDKGSVVNYSTAYASNPASTMQYRLDLTLEQVDA